MYLFILALEEYLIFSLLDFRGFLPSSILENENPQIFGPISIKADRKINFK